MLIHSRLSDRLSKKEWNPLIASSAWFRSSQDRWNGARASQNPLWDSSTVQGQPPKAEGRKIRILSLCRYYFVELSSPFDMEKPEVTAAWDGNILALEAHSGQGQFRKRVRGSEEQNAAVLHLSYLGRLRVLNLSSSSKSGVRGTFHLRLDASIIESFIITAIWCRYSLDLLGSIASLKEEKLKSPRSFLNFVSVFSRFK